MPERRTPDFVHVSVQTRDDGGRVATVTLDNQAKLNIVNTPILNELIAALAPLATDEALRDLPGPVIARIDGYALGAGLEVAASCDLRVATDRASFGMPEVQVGIPSVIEAALLPSLIGWGKTRELVYTGDRIDAREALACGLVDRVVPADDLDAAVGRWLESICTAGPHAIRSQKRLLREWERLPLDDAIAAGIRAFRETYAGDEPRDAMRRFLQR